MVSPTARSSLAPGAAQASSASTAEALRQHIERRRVALHVAVAGGDAEGRAVGGSLYHEGVRAAVRHAEGMLAGGCGDRREDAGPGVESQVDLAEEVAQHVVEGVAGGDHHVEGNVGVRSRRWLD